MNSIQIQTNKFSKTRRNILKIKINITEKLIIMMKKRSNSAKNLNSTIEKNYLMTIVRWITTRQLIILNIIKILKIKIVNIVKMMSKIFNIINNNRNNY
jgi:hypothetical protein